MGFIAVASLPRLWQGYCTLVPWAALRLSTFSLMH